MSTVSKTTLHTRKDFVPNVDVRWCPGCGDYSILSAVQKTFAELQIPKEDFVVVSGIGCSSRLPYYMNTYGFHTIHGRAPSVATGIKIANPDLSVWLITGDGDGLSIGGNHLLHVLRRNMDINILLFNNRIYGLTKGQYSPTSERGKITKTSPLGSLETPINPLSFALAAEATFVARTTDTNPKHMIEVFKAAAAHKGTSFVEIFQNCVIFNNGTFDDIADRSVRDERMLVLEHGKPLIFGKERDKGIRLNGFKLEIVKIGENGITENDLLIHDAKAEDSTYAHMLTKINYPEYPTPMGVFRNVYTGVYDELLQEQINISLERSGEPDLEALLKGKDYWEVEKSINISHKGTGASETEIIDEEMAVMKEQLHANYHAENDPFASVFSKCVSESLKDYGTEDPITIDINTSIAETIRLFHKYRKGSFPVIENGKLAGIVTERDVFFKVPYTNIDREKTSVTEIMTTNAEFINDGQTISEALRVISAGRFRHLPVKSGDKLIGLISIKGLIRFIYHEINEKNKP